MMRPYSSFLPLVSPFVPGCPAPTIINMVREAARYTCEQTLMYRYQPPLFNLLPGVHEYAYNTPDQTEVHAVFGVHINGRPIMLLNLEQALRAFPEWADLYSGEDPSILWSLTPQHQLNTYEYNEQLFNQNSEFVLPEAIVAKASSPAAHTQLTPDRYIILPLPNAHPVYIVRMFLALKPSRASTHLHKAIADELEECIKFETLSRLMLIPNEPWTDDNKVVYFNRQAKYHRNEQRARANMGNNRASMSVQYRPF